MKKDEHARKRKELTKRKIQEEKTAALNRLVSFFSHTRRHHLTASSSNPKPPKLVAPHQSLRRYSCSRGRLVKLQLKSTKSTRVPTPSIPAGSAQRMAFVSQYRKSGSARAPAGFSDLQCHPATVPLCRRLIEDL